MLTGNKDATTKAKNKYAAAYQYRPTPPITSALGLLLVRKADKSEALQELTKTAKQAPENDRYAYVYAIGLNSAGKQREAMTILKAANARQPYNLDILSALISIHREMGDNNPHFFTQKKLQNVT